MFGINIKIFVYSDSIVLNICLILKRKISHPYNENPYKYEKAKTFGICIKKRNYSP